MKKYNRFKILTIYFLVLILIVGIYCYPVTALELDKNNTTLSDGIAVNSFERIVQLPSVNLQSSKVRDKDGNWVTNNGVYYDKWKSYNCYAYAIHKSDKWYLAGNISGGSYCVGTATVQDIADLVRDDLENMGYSNIVQYDYIPIIDATQELICFRKTSPTSDSQDFHFMRYDYETSAWYHKPGNSAILRYNGIPENDTEWPLEWFDQNGVGSSDEIIYSGDIVFITYSKNIINVGESVSKSINPDKEILCEINIDTLGDYTLHLNSQYFVEYELYNEDLDVIMSGNKHSETVGFQVAAGTYYLRMNFETYNADVGQVNVSVTNEHTHSYTHHYIWKSDMTHWSYCSCGNEISQPHVVSSSHSTICMLCRGMAGGGLLNSIPGDLPHTENGSYILPSGIIVLAPEDEEAYFNGTLEFRTGEIM